MSFCKNAPWPLSRHLKDCLFVPRILKFNSDVYGDFLDSPVVNTLTVEGVGSILGQESFMPHGPAKKKTKKTTQTKKWCMLTQVYFHPLGWAPSGPFHYGNFHFSALGKFLSCFFDDSSLPHL